MTLAAVVLITVFAAISGVNDGGNLVGTFLSSRSLSVRITIPLLIVGIGLGPVLFGTAVSHTIAVEVVDFQRGQLLLLVIALFSAVTTMLIAWLLRTPSSTTIALSGGMIGAAWANGQGALIRWTGVTKILVGMSGSIVVGFLVAFLLTQGMWFCFRKLQIKSVRVVSLQYLTIFLQGLAYGANDQEKAVGLTALLFLLSGRTQHFTVSWEAIVLPLFFWIAGLFLGGLRIAQTVNNHIFRIKALHSLSTEVSSAIVVIGAAVLGLPISTTQTIDGGLFGVGAATNPWQVKWKTARQLLLVWAITLPMALIIGSIFGLALRSV